jgi:hypothetical protein
MAVKSVKCVQIALLWVGPWKILLIAYRMVAIADGMWAFEINLGMEVKAKQQRAKVTSS